MKYVKTFEQHTQSSTNPVSQLLGWMAKLGSGMQQKLAQAKLQALTPIQCQPLEKVLKEEDVKRIKQGVRPRAKECYANAYHTAAILNNKDVKYVEGYIVYAGIPIEHAFNKIGDQYFDVTQEVALGKDVSEQQYFTIGEWDADTALMFMASGEYQCYGGVFDKEFIENNPEPVKSQK